MKRSLFLLMFLLPAVPLFAQVLDSVMLNRTIFEVLADPGPNGNRVTLVQQEALYLAVQQQIASNASPKIQGYRIRIFSSNQQTARNTSLAVKEEFEHQYPQIKAYLVHRDIDFRVTVGDFRTRSEAERFKKILTAQSAYRSAIVVGEEINYPAL